MSGHAPIVTNTLGTIGSARARRTCAGFATTFGALAMLTGCEGGPRNVAGVGAPTVLAPSDVHVLGTSESIAIVGDMDVRSDGSVWVLNSVEPFFIGFAPDGQVIHEYGSQGGGPEEFRYPVGFVSRGIDEQAWALDVRRHALVRISQPSADWSETTLAVDVLPPGSLIGGLGMLNPQVRTARLGEEIVLARSSGSLASGLFSFSLSIWGADLIALDPATGTTRELLSLGAVLGDPTEVFKAPAELPPILMWFRLWAVCSGDQIRVYDRLHNELRGFTSDGIEVEPIALPPVRLREVEPEQFAGAIYEFRLAETQGEVGRQVSTADSLRIINSIVQDNPATPAQLADMLPRYVDFRCTEQGDFWMRPFDPNAGGLRGGPAWLRITADGATSEVHFPDGFDPYRFTEDRIWGVQRDELDVASVAWIDLRSIG